MKKDEKIFTTKNHNHTTFTASNHDVMGSINIKVGWGDERQGTDPNSYYAGCRIAPNMVEKFREHKNKSPSMNLETSLAQTAVINIVGQYLRMSRSNEQLDEFLAASMEALKEMASCIKKERKEKRLW